MLEDRHRRRVTHARPPAPGLRQPLSSRDARGGGHADARGDVGTACAAIRQLGRRPPSPLVGRPMSRVELARPPRAGCSERAWSRRVIAWFARMSMDTAEGGARAVSRRRRWWAGSVSGSVANTRRRRAELRRGCVGRAERCSTRAAALLYTYSSGTLVCTTTSAQSRPPKSPEVSAPRGGAWVGAWVSE